jgi:hypothetical protein
VKMAQSTSAASANSIMLRTNGSEDPGRRATRLQTSITRVRSAIRPVRNRNATSTGWLRYHSEKKPWVGVPNAGGALDGPGPTNVGDKRLRQQTGLCREPLPIDCSNQPFNLRPTLIAERNNSE